MKRIFLVLVVVALMAMMVVVMAAPAFAARQAKPPAFECGPDQRPNIEGIGKNHTVICEELPPQV